MYNKQLFRLEWVRQKETEAVSQRRKIELFKSQINLLQPLLWEVFVRATCHRIRRNPQLIYNRTRGRGHLSILCQARNPKIITSDQPVKTQIQCLRIRDRARRTFKNQTNKKQSHYEVNYQKLYLNFRLTQCARLQRSAARRGWRP